MSSQPLSPAIVTGLLKDRLDPALECVRLTAGSVGNAQETWFVEAVGKRGAPLQLVIRRSAQAGSLEHTARAEEYAILRTLEPLGFPVPRVYWLEEEGSSLGEAYFVMDRLPGTPPTASLASRARIGVELGQWLGRLHEVDMQQVPPEIRRSAGAESATREQLRDWQAEYRRSRTQAVPLVGALLGWLEARLAPSSRPLALLWGDPGPHNLLVEDGRIRALLDWELVHLGDPLEDLGAAMWSCFSDTLEREDIVSGYEQIQGAIDRDALAYFEVFACVNRSIMALGGISAFLAGKASPSMAALGQYLLLVNLERAAGLAGWEAPASIDSPPAPQPLPMRPDVDETLAGVTRFLLKELLPAVGETRLRRELKSAAALLESARDRIPAAASLPPVSADELEEQAAQAERQKSPQRELRRSQLLADMTSKRKTIRALDRLYGGATR
jgi:aminoglycoside phosphotransferase (APT) family kinase protein